MIEAFTAYRADQPLHKRILPGAPIGGFYFLDTQAFHALLKNFAVDRIVVTE